MLSLQPAFTPTGQCIAFAAATDGVVLADIRTQPSNMNGRSAALPKSSRLLTLSGD